MPQQAREYRKTSTVFARKVEPGEQAEIEVYSLEGLAIARPGDYIVTAKSTYEPVE